MSFKMQRVRCTRHLRADILNNQLIQLFSRLLYNYVLCVSRYVYFKKPLHDFKYVSVCYGHKFNADNGKFP
jgi:hypothetical protein